MRRVGSRPKKLEDLLPKRLEKHEQADGVDLLEMVGAKCYVLGTRRRQRCHHCGTITKDQGTRQTPGISDVLAFLPLTTLDYGDGRVSVPRRKAVWFEFKREKNGRLTAEQQEFRELCQQADVEHIVANGVKDVAAYLKAGGWLK